MKTARAGLIFLFVTVALVVSPTLALNEVKIHINYPADTVFAGAMNTVEIWVENHEPLAAMSLPFSYSTTAGVLTWVTPYGTIPAGNPYVKIDAQVDPMTWAQPLNGWQCTVYGGNQFLVTGVAVDPAFYFSAHPNSTRIYSLKLDGSTLVDNGGYFCVDAIFIPPAGTFTFDTGHGGYVPGFYECPNCNPDDPEVCFPVVQRPWAKGDASGDGVLDVSDAVFLIRYIFEGGAAPAHVQAGDVNCDDQISVSDVVKIIHYIFAGGSAPC